MAAQNRSKGTSKNFGKPRKLHYVDSNPGILSKMSGNSYEGVCSPLGVWREDAPTLHPHCSRIACNAPILTGDRYFIIPKTNLVLCIPCAS